MPVQGGLGGRYLYSGGSVADLPALQGSLQVAINTDMSLGLAVVSTAFALFVVVALWCGLLQRILIAGGILREAADCVASMPSILLLLSPLLIFVLSVLFTYWMCIAMLIASAGIPSRGFIHYDRRLQVVCTRFARRTSHSGYRTQ